MHNASIDQIVGIWSDLDDCFYGKNSYGSSVAEIYLYRVQPNNPSYSFDGGNYSTNVDLKAYDVTGFITLFNIFKLFEEKRNVTIEVDEYPKYKEYIWNEKSLIYHRIHVRVFKNK
jgi:hypothetical protein